MSPLPLGILAGSAASLPSITVNYLVIAGGGGARKTTEGLNYGGGGAGGYRCSMPGELSGENSSAETAFAGMINTFYSVTVGAGGNNWIGNNSWFDSVISLGGGGGGYDDDGDWEGPTSGGSGGGGALDPVRLGASGSVNQGFAGGNGSTVIAIGSRGGGGGGAGGAGQDGGINTGGNGGTGIASSITGSSVFRAGGGAGGVGISGGTGGTGGGGNAGSNGAVNTGGGGGVRGRGGSGVVILRYPNTFTITIGAGLTGSTTTVGSDSVTTITAGTGNVSWAA